MHFSVRSFGCAPFYFCGGPTMLETEHRPIFEADFSSLPHEAASIFKIEKEYSHIITDDSHLMSKAPQRIDELIKFISACIYLARSAKTEISIDVTEESEELTVFLASDVFRFNTADLFNLSHVCLSAINITILSGDDTSSKALICIAYNYSEGKHSVTDRLLK